MLILNIIECPNNLDELLERYYLNRLKHGQARALEEHAVKCPRCFQELMLTGLFLESLISALREMEEEPPGAPPE